MEYSEELKGYLEQQAKAFEDYKAVHKKDMESAKAETKEKLEKLEKELQSLETKISSTFAKIEEEKKTKEDYEKKFKELDAKMNRPRGEGNTPRLERKDFITEGLYQLATEEKAEEKAAATFKALRTPVDLTPEEKVLTLNDPETGGYLAPPEFLNEIIKELREITPALQVADVRTTSRNQIIMAKKTGTISAKRRGESETKTESTGLTYATESVVLEELYAYMDVTEMDLEDTMFNLESEIREEITDAFNAKIGTEFINGSGPLQLEGLLVNSDIASINVGAASTLDPNGLIAFVVAGLKAQYQPRAQLMFNLSTLSKIRQQQDGAGAYIWAPGFGTTPNNVLGKQYVISEDMPDVAADAFPILYGDFKKGYKIGLRVRMAIKRITDSALDQSGLVRFSGRMRIGGRVVQANAIKKLKIAA